MINEYVSGRVGVFIDEANLFHSQKTLGWRIDYNKLYWLLYDLNLGVKNIFLYTSFLLGNIKQINFLAKLVEYGYVVHSKEVKEIKDKSGIIIRKGNLDIELALDAYRFSSVYDTLILFSGDSDFAYLIDILKEQNKQIIIVSSKSHISRELLRRGQFIDLNQIRTEIEYIKHKTTLIGVALDGTTESSISL